MASSASNVSTHQPTGSFCYESSLASSRYSSTPHRPLEALASHCIRIVFGERVQWVADGLLLIGATGEQSAVSFGALWSLMQRKQESVTTCVRGDGPLAFSNHKSSLTAKAVDKSAVRAALLVLIQHSVVSVRRKASSNNSKANSSKSNNNFPILAYRYHPERAARLDGCRYARYVEHVKRALDPSAAIVVETLLLNGRLRTVDLVSTTVQQQQQEQDTEQSSPHHKYTARETSVDALTKLVRGGYLEMVPPIPDPKSEEDANEGEALFGDKDEPPPKRIRLELDDALLGLEQIQDGGDDDNKHPMNYDEDPAVLKLIKGNALYKSTLPIEAVWRVNQNMLHDSIRALCLGRLVEKLYGHKVQSAESLVTAALKYRAYLGHSKGAAAESGVRPSDTAFFTPNDVMKFLPKSVVQLMENKASKFGSNVSQIVTTAFLELAEIRVPTTVVRRVGEDLFEVAHASLLEYLRKRICSQLVEDRHGQVAARIIAVLSQQGWLESDTLATAVMVPAKDTRAILHELYRSRYIDLFQLSTSHSAKQQYNSSSSIYLWCVHRDRLQRKVVDDVLTAMRNLRLRRQHEAEVVGREWIERAQRQAFEDENENQTDKFNQQKFELGLERIDVALQQLDETLLALIDF